MYVPKKILGSMASIVKLANATMFGVGKARAKPTAVGPDQWGTLARGFLGRVVVCGRERAGAGGGGEHGASVARTGATWLPKAFQRKFTYFTLSFSTTITLIFFERNVGFPFWESVG